MRHLLRGEEAPQVGVIEVEAIEEALPEVTAEAVLLAGVTAAGMIGAVRTV
jgi:hypothetical protein